MRTFTSKALTCLFFFAMAVAVRPARADSFEALNAYQHSSSFTLGAGFSEVCSTVTTLPAKKRLVIQYVSALVGPVQSGSQVRFVQLVTSINGDKNLYHNISQNYVGTFELVFGQAVKVYADGLVQLCVARTGMNLNTPMPVAATVSGYLVDIP